MKFNFEKCLGDDEPMNSHSEQNDERNKSPFRSKIEKSLRSKTSVLKDNRSLCF
jgi:hypothetical protein